MRRTPATTGTLQSAARALWGAGLLLAPARLIHAAGSTPTRSALSIARLLGVRHLLQAAVTVAVPSAQTLRWGAATDAAHAATGLALAAGSSRWRRTALLDSAIAAGFGVASLGGSIVDQPTDRTDSL